MVSHGPVQIQALHLVFERLTGRLITVKTVGGCYEPQVLVSHYLSSNKRHNIDDSTIYAYRNV